MPAGIVARKQYLAAVQRHPICVTTSGLRGSTGWKMGEYVAASRAIVAEQLNYSVPGGFASPQNYLEFVTPEECVQDVERLVRDRELRTEIMIRNRLYYMNQIRPDVLIANTLCIAGIITG